MMRVNQENKKKTGKENNKTKYPKQTRRKSVHSDELKMKTFNKKKKKNITVYLNYKMDWCSLQ